jgi:hypothetical protein
MSVCSFHCHNLIFRNSNSRDVINIITLCVIFISALTITHGQRSNFTIVGCRFRSLHHVSAQVPLPGSYIRGEWGKITVYQFIAFAAATIIAIFAHL